MIQPLHENISAENCRDITSAFCKKHTDRQTQELTKIIEGINQILEDNGRTYVSCWNSNQGLVLYYKDTTTYDADNWLGYTSLNKLIKTFLESEFNAHDDRDKFLINGTLGVIVCSKEIRFPSGAALLNKPKESNVDQCFSIGIQPYKYFNF